MRAPGFHDTTPIFCVSNLAASLSYYVDSLGFSVAWSWSDYELSFDRGAPTFACVRRGDCSLFLGENSHGQPGAWVFVNLRNLDDYALVEAEYAASGAIIVAAAEDKPWGAREMVVADLDDNRLRVSCPLAEQYDLPSAPRLRLSLVVGAPTSEAKNRPLV